MSIKPIRLIDCVEIKFTGPEQLALAIVSGTRAQRRELLSKYRSEFEAKFIASCRASLEEPKPAKALEISSVTECTGECDEQSPSNK